MTYRLERELCADFIAAVREIGEWEAYPETAGFDILLVHKATGVQLGIEAKLRLSAKAIKQVYPWRHSAGEKGPDLRAILVPSGKIGDLGEVCRLLGIGIITFDPGMRRGGPSAMYRGDVSDQLPIKTRAGMVVFDRHWHDWCPNERETLPEYVPDVPAGDRAPVQLSEWKIKAIKLQIILRERPVTRADFKALGLSTTRWLDREHGWLVKDARSGGYVPNEGMPDLQKQHPEAWAKIEADGGRWRRHLPEFQPVGLPLELDQHKGD